MLKPGYYVTENSMARLHGAVLPFLPIEVAVIHYAIGVIVGGSAAITWDDVELAPICVQSCMCCGNCSSSVP